MKKTFFAVTFYFLLLMILLASCVENYSFSQNLPSNNLTVDSGTVGDVIGRITPTTPFIKPPEDNSYICACRVFVPVACTNTVFACGLIGTGTYPADDSSMCDFGTRESSICFPSRFDTEEQVEQDCNGRIRNTVLLGLRWAFRTCMSAEPNQFCSIRIMCTAHNIYGRIQTRRIDRCEPGVCWPEPLNENVRNARTATYVPISLQLHCSNSETNLTRSQQDVCGTVGF